MHINEIVKNSHARANLIIRCFTSKDVVSLSRAFVTYVCPLLEYCSPIWSPTAVSAINQIEAVQRRFSKRLPGLNQLCYFDRLVVLGWSTLETRRIQADLLLCFKIVHRLISTELESIFILNKCSISTRGHKYKLTIQRSNTKVRQNFFAVRVVPIWNELPAYIVESVSVKLFKHFIKFYDLSKFCKVDLFN